MLINYSIDYWYVILCRIRLYNFFSVVTYRDSYLFLSMIISFLRASAMLKHVIDIGWTSVRPSVRPSVTRWYCIKTAEYIVMISKR